MKLYAIKTEEGYLRFRKEAVPEFVKMNKASVYSSLEEAKALRNAYGKGVIAELTLTEKILDL